MTTFLFVAHGTDGDVLPVIRVAADLRSRGHEVALLSHARYSARCRQQLVRFVAIDTAVSDQASQDDDDADLNNIGARTDLARVRDYYERHGFTAQFRFECRALRRLHRPDRTVLVGLSLSSLSVLTTAQWLGVPAICLAASPFHLAILDRAAAEYREVFANGVNQVRDEFGVARIADWPAFLRGAHATIATWPQWFDDAGRPAPTGTTLTGFVLADADDASDHVSDDVSGDGHADYAIGGVNAIDPATVLIAGSSGRLTSARFYTDAVAACVAARRPALLVTRHRELVPDRLPETILWRAHLPFRTIMPLVDAVIHHGGIGTAARALAAGTPQLILADGFDRPDNAQRLAKAGLADWMPQAHSGTAAVGQRLSGMLARGRINRPDINPVDSVRAAADAIESSGAALTQSR